LNLNSARAEIYRYLDVPPQAYSELLAAPSKGLYFNSNIRQQFTFRHLNRSPSAKSRRRLKMYAALGKSARATRCG
jgi:hypothetical protein